VRIAEDWVRIANCRRGRFSQFVEIKSALRFRAGLFETFWQELVSPLKSGKFLPFSFSVGYDEAVRELLSEHDSGEELPLP
jgi:hypothetical protein